MEDSQICLEIGGAKPRGTKLYKEWYEKTIAENNGRMIVEPQVYIQAKAAAHAVRTNKPARMKLNKCTEKEIGLEWQYMNFSFRGFLDGLHRDGQNGLILDLKTCADAEPKKFQREIVAMDYHLQAAMYMKAIGEIIPYYWVAADKKGGVSVHLADKKLIDVGFERYDYLMNRLNDCILLDAWDRSYDFYSERNDGIFIADKPAYMY